MSVVTSKDSAAKVDLNDSANVAVDMSVLTPPEERSELPAPAESPEEMLAAAQMVITGLESGPSIGGRMVYVAARVSRILEDLPQDLNRPKSPNNEKHDFDKDRCGNSDTEWKQSLEAFCEKCLNDKLRIEAEIRPLWDIANQRGKALDPSHPDKMELLDLQNALHNLPKIFGRFVEEADKILNGEASPEQIARTFKGEFEDEVFAFPHQEIAEYQMMEFIGKNGRWNHVRLLDLLESSSGSGTERKVRMVPLATAVEKVVGRLGYDQHLVETITFDDQAENLMVPESFVTTVVGQFIKNARDELCSKHMKSLLPRGNRNIFLTFQVIGDKLLTSIEDNGPGLPPNIIEGYRNGWTDRITNKSRENGHSCHGTGKGLQGNLQTVEALGGKLIILTENQEGLYRLNRDSEGELRVSQQKLKGHVGTKTHISIWLPIERQ